MDLKSINQEALRQKYLKGLDVKPHPTRLGFVVSFLDKAMYIDKFSRVPDEVTEGTGEFEEIEVFSEEFGQNVWIKQEIKRSRPATQKEKEKALFIYVEELQNIKSILKSYAKRK